MLQLDSERLFLRLFELPDAKTIRDLASDRELASTTLSIPHPYPEGGAEQFVAGTRAAAESGAHYTCGIFRKTDGVLVGCVGLEDTNSVHRKGELGYWIGRPYWGNGYATEAAGRLIGFGFAELGLNKVWAAHMTRNPSSGRVMQKLGMTYEGTNRQDIVKWGRFEDVAVYSILSAEYEARMKPLQYLST